MRTEHVVRLVEHWNGAPYALNGGVGTVLPAAVSPRSTSLLCERQQACGAADQGDDERSGS